MDKSALLTDRVTTTTGTVSIEGIGEVTVRGLSRYEMVLAAKIGDGDDLKQERFILSCAMVDPELTEDEVAAWQKASPPGEINEVATKVNELSGIGQGAAKS
jgi:hypothetical protein